MLLDYVKCGISLSNSLSLSNFLSPILLLFLSLCVDVGEMRLQARISHSIKQGSASPHLDKITAIPANSGMHTPANVNAMSRQVESVPFATIALR